MMNRRHARLLVLTVLAIAVVSTPSDARQEVSNPQQVSDVFARAWQGDADAQVTLGGWYFSGQGVPKDADEGVRWWRQAAEQGHLPAQTGLGGRYYDGRGVVQDESEAVRWYRLAAEQGHVEAQLTLGSRYDTGRGVAQDEAEAVRCSTGG